jgi:MoxR-vWA-beta-propeller ternary system domain bpX3
MTLHIKPNQKNSFPFGAILIKSESVVYWLQEMQAMQLPLAATTVYAIPNVNANHIWGCIIIPNTPIKSIDIRSHAYCQLVHQTLFIPDKTSVHPYISAEELVKILNHQLHILHPIFGFVALGKPIAWQTFLALPKQHAYLISAPEPSVFIPQNIKSFSIKALSPEDTLANLEKNILPTFNHLQDKPLNNLEKGKLALLKALLGDGNQDKDSKSNAGFGGAAGGIVGGIMGGLMGGIAGGVGKLFGNAGKNLIGKMQQNADELEARNNKSLNKLMDLFKNNLDEALKYAIPLDSEGTGRGGSGGGFELSKIWSSFSLFGNSGYSSGGGGSANFDAGFYTLQQQYRASAKQLEDDGDCRKAAFIYLKLLKDFYAAAYTLEKGKYYQEAAIIYLKYQKNKEKAAQCYEQGNMIVEAIELYKELNDDEKVGDLYLKLNNRKEANTYYLQKVETEKNRNDYLNAAAIFKQKMNDAFASQQVLLEAFDKNIQANRCLHEYFEAIEDESQLQMAIEEVFERNVKDGNCSVFLDVLKHQHNKPALRESTQEIAYKIIATQVVANPQILNALKMFTTADKEIVKDTIRYNVGRKK